MDTLVVGAPKSAKPCAQKIGVINEKYAGMEADKCKMPQIHTLPCQWRAAKFLILVQA